MVTKPVFRPSFGNRPDQLIGRGDALDQIIEGLQCFPGNAERAVMITGQRGMGKTALLLEIADRARELGYVVARTTCGETMLDNLIEALQRAGSSFVKESQRSIKGFTVGALGFSVGLTFTEEARATFGFRTKLEMICERLAQCDKRVLLLVDEVDPSVKELRALATGYQELVGEEADIAIVMAGLPSAVSDTLNYKTLTFLNRATRVTLSTIPIYEVETYYHSAFARSDIQADATMTHRSAEATEGFPYLVQLIGYHLAKLSQPGSAANEEMLTQARRAAGAELNERVFEAMLNPLSDADIAFLRAMARDDGPTKTSSLEGRLGVTHGTVQTYRARLIESGVIVAPRRGEVAFVIPSLADYLRQ